MFFFFIEKVLQIRYLQFLLLDNLKKICVKLKFLFEKVTVLHIILYIFYRRYGNVFHQNVIVKRQVVDIFVK